MRGVAWLVVFIALIAPSCASDEQTTKNDAGPGPDVDTDADTDTDSDIDTDSDSNEPWCPELETSCEDPALLEACGDDALNAARLIFPLSGRHIRDRRPRIVWEAAADVAQYRLEIARDRAFTEPVYYSTEYEPLGDDRFEHVVGCDLDCGVHFFRVKSVTAPECETGSASFTWQMFVGMAPGDLDRDGVPDIAHWSFVEGTEELETNLVQAWAFFNLDEQKDEAEATKVVEFPVDEEVSFTSSPEGFFPGDTNGDGFADLGLVYSYYEDDDDYSTVVTKLFIFSGLTADAVASEEDAVRRLVSAVGEEYQESKWQPHAATHRFSDFDGDGMPDIAFTRFNFYSDTGEPNELLILPSANASSEIEDFQDSAIHVACPIWCTSEHGYLPGLFFADVNADGLGDLWVGVEDESTYWHQLFVFGAEELENVTEPIDAGVVVSPSATDVVVGDWNLSRSVEIGFPVGDIDGDGRFEVAGANWAYDHTTAETVTTYGFAVLEDGLPNGAATYNEAIDFSLVSGFPVSDYENTEKLASIYGVGDMDGDRIEDLLLSTTFDNLVDNGRIFPVDGTTEWPELFDVADVSGGFFPEGGQPFFYRAIADVDGDGSNDILFRSSTVGTQPLHLVLSGSGDRIDMPLEWAYAYPTVY